MQAKDHHAGSSAISLLAFIFQMRYNNEYKRDLTQSQWMKNE